jgi:hypothetical protein
MHPPVSATRLARGAVHDVLRRIPIVEPVDKRISAAIIGVPQ